MEFKINNNYFKKAILEVSRVVSSRTPLPILSGINIIANNDSLTLVGSNSDIIIERTIPKTEEGIDILEIYKTGSVVISAKYLSEIIKKLPNDIIIKVNENQSVTIRSEEITTKLNGLNIEEYPSLPVMDLSNYFGIPTDDLLVIIKQTVFATSKSDTKPILTGVNFSFQDNFLTCVATNSHRLALKLYSIKSNLNGSYIVPSASLIELSKLLSGQNTFVDIFISKTHIVFKSTGISFYSRLIDGSYPNTVGLIPKESKTVITMDTKQLLNGIDRASLFASEWRNNNINLQIIGKSKVRISSKSSEIGQIEELQTIKNITGDEELNVTLDGNYVMAALKVIKEDDVSISFNGPMKPILIHPFGNESQLHLISPVRSY